MSFGDHLENGLLDHYFGNSSFSAPSNYYVAAHIATTTADSSTAGDSNIDLNNEVAVGAKLVIEPVASAEETHYAASVSDNGDGTWTVGLESSDGSSTTLSNDHASGVYVKHDPADDGTTVMEPADGYGRVSTASADWNSASNGELDNASNITFPQSTGDWGLVTHCAIYDASTGGNFDIWGELGSPREILNGDTLQLPAGDATVTLD